MAIAVRALKLAAIEGETVVDSQSAGGIKVAFATTDNKTVDAHFGGARTFAVYEVDATSSRFVEALQFDQASAQDGKHNDTDDRIGPKVEAMAGIGILFVRAIGGPAAAKVVNAHIHPVKLPADEPIAEVIGKLQAMLAGSPPPWLRKLLKGPAPKPSFLDDED